ncbi:MAG: radical SAM protein [Candidatus Omnitrophota bacterium]
MFPKFNLRRVFLKLLKQPVYALKVLSRRLPAYLAYYSGTGKSSNPESITIFLTHRCNLHCYMCGQWGNHGSSAKINKECLQEELTLEVLKKFIKDLAVFKPNITLFGGEPLLYKDGCLKIVRLIKENNMHCLMITNGVLLLEQAEEIVSSGLDELNVSLDGPAFVHDDIRGLPGLFDKVACGIERVNYFKKLRKVKKPLVNLQCTINQKNYEFIDQLLPLARELEVNSVTFHNLIFINEKMLSGQKEYDRLLQASSSGWDGFVFSPGMDVSVLRDKLKQVFENGSGLKIDIYPDFKLTDLGQYYADPEKIPGGYLKRCLSPWITAYLFCDGQIRPCLNSSFSYGNIKEKPFSQIWNSAQAIKFRKLLKEKRIFPACPRCTELYRY